MLDEQIKAMAERFLSWPLPEDFNPDGGISAVRPNYGHGVKWQPTGTNLFTYTQAVAMVRHMLDGQPGGAAGGKYAGQPDSAAPGWTPK